MSSASCVCTSSPFFSSLTARAPSYIRPVRATPTPAVAAVFIFMTVIQSETCAPICFSGHLFCKHGIASRRGEVLPSAPIWRPFLKVWISFLPSSLGYDQHLMQMFPRRTDGEDYAKENGRARHCCLHRIVEPMCLLARTVIKEIKPGLRARKVEPRE